MAKRALVAGGAGFIGSHLCELLLEKGYQVDAADNEITGSRKNIEHLYDKGLNWLELDINTNFYLNKTYDEIYNLASPASPIDFERIPLFILNTGSDGQRNLLEHARKMKARILFASTSEVYGDPEVHPQNEEYRGNVSTTGPRSCYDEAKRFGEALTYAYKREHNLDVRVARIFNTYGPRMNPEDGRVIPNFFTQAIKGQPLTIYGDGTQTRSLCYVKDMAWGIYSLMQSTEERPTNIGNPIELTVLDIATKIKEITKTDTDVVFKPLPQDDPLRRRPVVDRAKEAFGWNPNTTLEDGLTSTYEYFKKILS